MYISGLKSGNNVNKNFKDGYGIVSIPVEPQDFYGGVARNRNVLQDALNPFYPAQPSTTNSCPVNLVYRTLPPYNEPTPETGGITYWETTVAGPATIKSLYTGIPNYYPPQLISSPVDTLYGHDYSLFHTSGVGKGKRMSYQAQMYPFTDRNVREFRWYADTIIPRPDFMSKIKNPVVRDATVNSPIQVLPQAYYP